MFVKSKPVEIIGVDTDTLESDGAFPEAYAFYVKLSDKPDPIWVRYFEEWKKALHAMRKEIRVTEDKLRLVFVHGDNIQNYVKFARQIVEGTNERIKKHNRKVELEEKREMAKQEESRRKEEEIRQKLRELGPDPMPAAIEITVEELFSAYEADEQTADARFGNKLLKVTGLVSRIEVKDILDIHYITVSSAEKYLLQRVRCVFDKGHGDELNELTKGETVTVQGKFDGSMVELRMRDCVLVR